MLFSCYPQPLWITRLDADLTPVKRLNLIILETADKADENGADG